MQLSWIFSVLRPAVHLHVTSFAGAQPSSEQLSSEFVCVEHGKDGHVSTYDLISIQSMSHAPEGQCPQMSTTICAVETVQTI